MDLKVSFDLPNIVSKTEPAWLSEKRKHGRELFKSMPEPVRKIEEWKYTDFSLLNIKSAADKGNIKQTFSEEMKKSGVIFCDIETAIKDHPDILKKYIFSAIKPEENIFTALHSACFSKGSLLYIPAKTNLTKPLLLSEIVTGSNFMHSIIVAEPGSSFTLIEDLGGQASYFSNFFEIFLKEGAQAKIISLQNLSSGVEFSIKRALLDKNSKLEQVFCIFGGDFSRLRLDCSLQGKGSEAKVYGSYIGTGKQIIELQTSVQHLVPHTTYDILARGALFGNSTAVHRGVNKIDKSALGANSWLRGHTLLFGDKSKSDVIPSLEIDTNDVQAGHEASVGKVDEEQLFYLMSRGLERREAERLIVQGYFEPVLQRIPDEVLRGEIKNILEEKVSNAS